MDDKRAPHTTRRDMTLQEVADIFRVSRETVRLWIRAGEFPHAYALPRGAGWRVPETDIEALRERGRVHTHLAQSGDTSDQGKTEQAS